MLWVVLGVASSADSLLTWAGVEVGAFREINPVVTAMGLPAKTLMVWALAWCVARLGYDQWLAVPVAAYAAIVLYQVYGLALYA